MVANHRSELCRTSEDLTPEDRDAELLPISVQQLYVLIRQGKSEEAESVLQEISVKDIPELSTKKIAENNVTLIRDTAANPFILYKALHETPVSTGNDRLFDFQNNIISSNFNAADLLVHKYDGIIRSTSKARAQAPYPSTESSINLLSVFNAAALARGQTGAKALKAILPALERRPKDIGLVLTAAQLYVSTGNTTAAIATLEKSLHLLDESISDQDKEVRFNPGLLGVLVSLYKLEGRKVQIRTELGKAAAYWRSQADAPSSLLRAAASSLLYSSDPADLVTASDLFQYLYQKDSSDRYASAGYVASHATLDYNKVASHVDRLPAVPDLVSGIDVSALEAAGVSPSSATAAAAAATIASARKRSAADKQHQGRVTKRVRKSRLPKDYDPSKTADPERWLPLRDRSSYRPRGRKGKQRAAERTQGGAVTEKTEEANASASQQRNQGGGGGGASKKNKKKGKR
ncbi:Signal recognition particle subunit SRP72 [Aspergillus melleus]|uniref:Signal recognition particle subunit SRP72 n=1 Tax=Aspergillus melleus TaxID=138277 RepID=UPI001E8E2E0C|nr:Signal recognition particle subunit SRP72 [Aspergillus melleus]KAH8428326.1 Signal recognition particle subunit SRP72 [Aspergillus melleus]